MNCPYCQQPLSLERCLNHGDLDVRTFASSTGQIYYTYIKINSDYVAFISKDEDNMLNINQVEKDYFKSILYHGPIPPNFSPEMLPLLLQKLLKLKAFL